MTFIVNVGRCLNNSLMLVNNYRYILADGSNSPTEIVCEAPGRGTSEFADCPKRTCRANVDCWVAYGKPQQCVCDPHFCGLVCLPGDFVF